MSIVTAEFTYAESLYSQTLELSFDTKDLETFAVTIRLSRQVDFKVEPYVFFSSEDFCKGLSEEIKKMITENSEDLYKLDLEVVGKVVVGKEIYIEVNGRGYMAKHTHPNNTRSAATNCSGGSYGGWGCVKPYWNGEYRSTNKKLCSRKNFFNTVTIQFILSENN